MTVLYSFGVPANGCWDPTAAALKVVHLMGKDNPISYLCKIYPILAEPCSLTCSACENRISGPLFGYIEHLNDQHHWSREQIADWLDSYGKTLLEWIRFESR